MKTPCPGFKLFITCQPDLKIILSLGTLVPLDYSSPLNITPPLVQYNQHAYTDNRKGKYFSSGLGPNRANRVFPCKNRSNKKSVHQRSLSHQQSIVFLSISPAPTPEPVIRLKPPIQARNPIRTSQSIFLPKDHAPPTTFLDCCFIIIGSLSVS